MRKKKNQPKKKKAAAPKKSKPVKRKPREKPEPNVIVREEYQTGSAAFDRMRGNY